ncbi:MAG: RHS repeat-associated core domain-containing protein, partial [Bacteroidota bacterium]
ISREIDENGNVTTYLYDGLDRRIRTTYPDGNSEVILYDAVSNPISVTTPGGDLLNYTYDASGNLLLADRPGTNDDSYSYDSSSRMLTATNPAASLVFTYDAAGRPLTESLNGKITTYTYDLPNNTTTLSYPSGRAITQLTDSRGNLTDVREGGTTLRSFTYDAADRITGATFANGATLTQVYDPAQRVASLDHASGAVMIASFDYFYSPTGQLIGRDFHHQPDASERYRYDHNNRLVQKNTGPVFNGSIPLPSTREAFLYDGSGNRTFDQQDENIRSFSRNNLNQYVSQTNGGSTTPLNFDGNGHLTDDGSNTYVFDTNSRLLSSGGAATASYDYDPLGRRIRQTVDGVVTNFYYAGHQMIEERDATDAVTATYVYGSNLDDLIGMQRGGVDYYFHQDAQGSIIAATDATGAVVERYGYQAFGASSFFAPDFSPLPASTIGNPYLFQGRRFDDFTGLYYFRERYYQPDLGRFLSRDPFGAVDGSNLYTFVGNDPANASDPLGTLRYIDRWTPSRQPIKWEEVGIDSKRTPGKTKVKYFKKDCCCIEASCDEFQLTTTTRFRGYQLFFKTNPRWWDLLNKTRYLTRSLASDLLNIN